MPDRVARRPTGVPISGEAGTCRYPDRIALIARQLGWLTPLSALSVDDQRILGLVNAAGRPMHSGDLEDGDGGDAPESEGPVLDAEHASAPF